MKTELLPLRAGRRLVAGMALLLISRSAGGRAVPGVAFPARHDRPDCGPGLTAVLLEFGGRQKGPQSAFHE